MAVKDATENIQEPEGRTREEGRVPAARIVVMGSEYVFAQIVFEIVYLEFARAPTLLETAQAIVGQRSAPEIEAFVMARCVPFDGVPHDQITGAQVLEVFIGCAEFVDGALAEMKKHRRSNRLILPASGDDKSQAFGENEIENVAKEREWLRREAVLAASPAMQAIKIVNRVCGPGNLNLHTFFLCFADRAPDARIESLKDAFGTAAQIEVVSPKLQRRFRPDPKICDPAKLDVSPGVLFSKGNGIREHSGEA